VSGWPYYCTIVRPPWSMFATNKDGSVQVVTDAVGGAFLRYTVVGREGNKAVGQYGNDRTPGPTAYCMNPVISHDLSITLQSG